MNEDLTFEEKMKRDGFTSSEEKHPPFKTVVDMYYPGQNVSKAMYHENFDDGYDFDLEAKERRMVVHYVSDFSTPIWWRIHNPNKIKV